MFNLALKIDILYIYIYIISVYSLIFVILIEKKSMIPALIYNLTLGITEGSVVLLCVYYISTFIRLVFLAYFLKHNTCHFIKQDYSEQNIPRP